jgi:hypothetical protein
LNGSYGWWHLPQKAEKIVSTTFPTVPLGLLRKTTKFLDYNMQLQDRNVSPGFSHIRSWSANSSIVVFVPSVQVGRLSKITTEQVDKKVL